MVRRKSRLSLAFDPRRKGLRKVLGDLEAEIMEAVWRVGEATVREVHESIGGRRELAYTTVMTVMSRLAEKELLVRREGTGKAIIYEPAMTRDDFFRQASASVLSGLFGDFGTPAMSHLVDVIGDESEDRIEELAKLIEERRKRK